MTRKVKVVNVNDDSTYADIIEAAVENEKAENGAVEENKPEEVCEPEPQPKPKARAKRVPKPKALERTDTVVDVDTAIELETATPPILETKPKPKRAAKVKIIETPLVVEQLPEKNESCPNPRAKKEELQIVVPAFPARLSRTEKREALYHSLASGALS